MTERLLIVSFGQWPTGRRVWPLHDKRYKRPRTAPAVFRHIGGAWRCVRYSPELYWFEYETPENLKQFRRAAERRGWRFEWARRYEL